MGREGVEVLGMSAQGGSHTARTWPSAPTHSRKAMEDNVDYRSSRVSARSSSPVQVPFKRSSTSGCLLTQSTWSTTSVYLSLPPRSTLVYWICQLPQHLVVYRARDLAGVGGVARDDDQRHLQTFLGKDGELPGILSGWDGKRQGW